MRYTSGDLVKPNHDVLKVIPGGTYLVIGCDDEFVYVLSPTGRQFKSLIWQDYLPSRKQSMNRKRRVIKRSLTWLLIDAEPVYQSDDEETV